jgi:hypothetical protein
VKRGQPRQRHLGWKLVKAGNSGEATARLRPRWVVRPHTNLCMRLAFLVIRFEVLCRSVNVGPVVRRPSAEVVESYESYEGTPPPIKEIYGTLRFGIQRDRAWR